VETVEGRVHEVNIWQPHLQRHPLAHSRTRPPARARAAPRYDPPPFQNMRHL